MNEHRCSGCLQAEYEEARKQAISDAERGLVRADVPVMFEWKWDTATIMLLPAIVVGIVIVGMMAIYYFLRAGR